MSYRLRAGEAPAQGIQRVIREQLDDAVAALSARSRSPADRREAVHTARKRLKAARAALRLVEAVMPEAARERARLRDIARTLAPLRDADAVIEAVDALAAPLASAPREPTALLAALADIRARLATRQEAAWAGATVAPAVRGLAAARERAAQAWRIEETGFDAIAPGLTRVYRLGRRRLAAAEGDPTPARLHRWRRAAKAHGYHMRLLVTSWPQELKARRVTIDELAESLGDDHDLVMLRLFVEEEGARSPARILAAIERRQATLRAGALALGARIYAEKPAALRARLRRYFRAPPLGAG